MSNAIELAHRMWVDKISEGQVNADNLLATTDEIALAVAKVFSCFSCILSDSKLTRRYRSEAETALQAYKFEQMGNADPRKYLFSKKEQWFIDERLDVILKHHLCKTEETIAGKIKNWFKSFNKTHLELNAARFNEKVEKFHGDKNYLIASHIIYLGSQSVVPTIFSAQIKALQQLGPSILKNYSKYINYYPHVQKALANALNTGINPQDLKPQEMVRDLAAGAVGSVKDSLGEGVVKNALQTVETGLRQAQIQNQSWADAGRTVVNSCIDEQIHQTPAEHLHLLKAAVSAVLAPGNAILINRLIDGVCAALQEKKEIVEAAEGDPLYYQLLQIAIFAAHTSNQDTLFGKIKAGLSAALNEQITALREANQDVVLYETLLSELPKIQLNELTSVKGIAKAAAFYVLNLLGRIWKDTHMGTF